MSCVSVQQIDGDECIGASLPKINNNFSVIADGLCDLSSTVVVLSTVIGSAGTVTNVTGTAPISVANGTSTPAISIAAATTAAAGSMSATDKARIDDASGVNGIVKCNGAGNFSTAVAGTDYLTSATLGSSPAAAKAWVTISDRRTTGTGTPLPVVLDSYNVSSIQLVAAQPYGGPVAYQINFTNSFVDTNYIICALVDNDMESDPTSPNGKFHVGISRKQTNNCAVRVSDWITAQSGIRCNMIDVIIFGQ